MKNKAILRKNTWNFGLYENTVIQFRDGQIWFISHNKIRGGNEIIPLDRYIDAREIHRDDNEQCWKLDGEKL